MNAHVVRVLRVVALAGIGIVGVGAVSSVAGMRINTSRSIPLGIYWTSAGAIQNGSYVFFCPPDSAPMAQAKQRGYLQAGHCPGGYGYMMKKVAASGGENVSISGTGVRVNGRLLPLSRPARHDLSGRPLARFDRSEFVLGGHEFLPMSDVSATSFDGRYYGPIDRAQIKSVIVPVLTW